MEDALLPLALVAHRTAPSVRKLLKFLTPENCGRRPKERRDCVREAARTTKIKLPRLVTERLALCDSSNEKLKKKEEKLAGARDQSVMLRFRIANFKELIRLELSIDLWNYATLYVRKHYSIQIIPIIFCVQKCTSNCKIKCEKYTKNTVIIYTSVVFNISLAF